MSNIKKTFGARIKEIRLRKNLNQEQLAELVNMESRQISRIETGSSFTSIENIAKIANALEVNISELFSFEHKKDKKDLIKEINTILTRNPQKVEDFYKIVMALVK